MVHRMISIAEVIEVLRGLRNITFVEHGDNAFAGVTLIDFDSVCSTFQGLIPEIGVTDLGRIR